MNLHFLDSFEFFTGVPDSLLNPLCSYLYDRFGISEHHIVAANEGNAVGLAAGYHLATGKVPVVYLQNSGEGNIVNPVASLMNDQVYGIPCLFIVGWRGEPGVHDEPQHVYQGRITVRLLEDLDIASYIISKETTQADIDAQMERFQALFKQGKQAAFVVRKGALEYGGKLRFNTPYAMTREEIIRHIAAAAREDVIVSTTGKASRELFELRAAADETHARDFLTVGSMGHASSIALAVALYRPERRVWCIDGDGAALMHLGAMPVIGSRKPRNLVHIVINNQCHETVGGMPTVANTADLTAIAKASGYSHALQVKDDISLDSALNLAKKMDGPVFIEALSATGARENLGRPTTTAMENKQAFMRYLRPAEDAEDAR